MLNWNLFNKAQPYTSLPRLKPKVSLGALQGFRLLLKAHLLLYKTLGPRKIVANVKLQIVGT